MAVGVHRLDTLVAVAQPGRSSYDNDNNNNINDDTTVSIRGSGGGYDLGDITHPVVVIGTMSQRLRRMVIVFIEEPQQQQPRQQQ